ncbi:MAG: glycine cleavage system aminomethyltransferase GcvT [Alphaproteobacteria bacterium]|nr:glycine cleavage system aminomethyltransferase GcvT [Alphaproteobacteria bacterium]
MPESPYTPSQRTPLYALHLELGGKMVPFAGYDMPVQYSGIIDEHSHTRTSASLFDVSHMGQIRVAGDAVALETLVPGDIQGLAAGRMRYSLFTDASGGILDDLMITRLGEAEFFVVVNAGCKVDDFRHMQSGLAGRAGVTLLPERALLALQGPAAAGVLRRLAPGSGALAFLAAAAMDVAGIPCFVSRSGYTGEDGFEISLAGDQAERLARRLLSEPGVKPAGLGARDSLRLEAGLCLYGHDIDRTTSPIEAGLAWTIAKRRRVAGGFPGAAVILEQLANGPARRRVGIRPEGRVVTREGTAILDSAGVAIGTITSGGFGPTVGGPVAMGYVAADQAKVGTPVRLAVRGTPRPGVVVALPFVATRYYRAT